LGARFSYESKERIEDAISIATVQSLPQLAAFLVSHIGQWGKWSRGYDGIAGTPQQLRATGLPSTEGFHDGGFSDARLTGDQSDTPVPMPGFVKQPRKLSKERFTL
jgi:hypothetical protein